MNDPPLLQRYSAPSGPMAAPLGPPGTSATIDFDPSGCTRVMQGANISTSTTLPSAIAMGPSGNRNPDVISVSSATAD